MTLYPRNASPALDEALFRNPTAEYRGTPFWSWNNRLDVAQLLRQIDVLRAMGFGGFHIHARTGLDTEYLGDDFMNAVVACTQGAAERSMLAWLYDEDRWPSGFAGGIVTRDERFRAKRLVWTRTQRSGEHPLARFEVRLKNGQLEQYRRLKDDEPAHPATWHAYLEPTPPDPWFNGQTDVDRFNREAIERFVAWGPGMSQYPSRRRSIVFGYNRPKTATRFPLLTAIANAPARGSTRCPCRTSPPKNSRTAISATWNST
jgi:hypothetical protein